MSDALEALIRQAEIQKIQLEMKLLLKSNLDLFKEKFPDIHKTFSNYQPKNVNLELDAQNNINLYHKDLNCFTYNEPPEAYAQKQISFFKKHGELRKFSVTPNKEYNDHHVHIPRLNSLLEKYSNTKATRPKSPPNYLTNMLVSGVGLGFHLLKLIDQFDIQNILIYEKCLDSFYGSLHVINWGPILSYFSESNRTIALCLGVEPRGALAQMEYSISRVGLFSQTFTFPFQHTKRPEETEFLQIYMSEMQAFTSGLGYYDDEQIGLAHAYHNLKSKASFFSAEKSYRRKSRLLIIGNGPSLDAHVDYIKRNQDTAIIMSGGSALGTLLRLGIKPDFHVEMERTVSTHNFINYGISPESLKGIRLLCLHTVSPTTIKNFDHACYAIKPNDAGGQLIEKGVQPGKAKELVFCNPTVANCALSFATYMGFNDIHLIGVDLGVPTEGAHHSKASVHYEMEKEVKAGEDFNYDYKDEKDLYVNGNFGGEVKTHKVLNASRVTIERFLALVTPNFSDYKVVNSNNGAKIKFTQTIKLEDIEDCQDYNKEEEIRSIESDHFKKLQNKPTEEKSKKTLNTLFMLEHELMLPNTIINEKQLYEEMQNIYGKINIKIDYTSHMLLRGTINCFFGAIMQNCMYCTIDSEFQERVKIGVEAYNGIMREIYERMKADPFRLDDTFNPILTKMAQKQNSPA